jgi:hypothetical protein
MNNRRNFLRMASAAAVPAAAIIAATSVAKAADDDTKEFEGAWNIIHTLPFAPFRFRELVSLSEGGVFHETNTFIHTASNLDFSMFGLPNAISGADGKGNWRRTGKGEAEIVFRKLLFDGSRQNFGDLYVTGTARSDGSTISFDARVRVVDTSDNVLVDFGMSSSQGTRIR